MWRSCRNPNHKQIQLDRKSNGGHARLIMSASNQAARKGKSVITGASAGGSD